MAYGRRRSSLLMFLTGALIMLGSLGTVATIVASRPASAGSIGTASPPACADCATVVGVKTVILDSQGNPLTALISSAPSPREYHVTVRLDDGTTRTLSQAKNAWQAGDRVRMLDGRLHAIDAS